MKRLFLVPVFAAAVVGLAPSASAQAIWGDTSRAEYCERQSYSDSRRAAYDNGFREGAKQGEKDGRKRDVFAYQDERTFQRADKGYSRDFGDIERYRQSFRSGYAAGYSDSYNRYAPANRNSNNGRYGSTYPSNTGRYDTRPGYGYPPQQQQQQGGYYTPAYNNGVNDGYEKGAEDARKSRSYDVLRHEWYRDGDRRYEARYGSKDQYKNVYREGFQEGYARGYQEGRFRY